MYKTLICAAVAAFTFSGTAHAALLKFSLTGDYTANWTLDSNPTVDYAGPPFPPFPAPYEFILVGVSGNFPGSDINDVDLIFSSPPSPLSLQILDAPGGAGHLLAAEGPQLFSGSPFTPTFLTGTFNLTEYEGEGRYTLVISQIPEPATWAMMIAGFGLVGSALRRRREAAIAA